MQSFSSGMFKLDDFYHGEAGSKGSENYLDDMMASSISFGIQAHLSSEVFIEFLCTICSPGCLTMSLMFALILKILLYSCYIDNIEQNDTIAVKEALELAVIRWFI